MGVVYPRDLCVPSWCFYFLVLCRSMFVSLVLAVCLHCLLRSCLFYPFPLVWGFPCCLLLFGVVVVLLRLVQSVYWWVLLFLLLVVCAFFRVASSVSFSLFVWVSSCGLLVPLSREALLVLSWSFGPLVLFVAPVSVCCCCKFAAVSVLLVLGVLVFIAFESHVSVGLFALCLAVISWYSVLVISFVISSVFHR